MLYANNCRITLGVFRISSRDWWGAKERTGNQNERKYEDLT
jgi:hypothetical protein